MSYTDALAQVAQINTEIAALQSAFTPSTSTSTDASSSTTPATGAQSFSTALASALSPTAATASTTSSGGVSATGATLPVNASTLLTSDQQAFASRLAGDTGLDPGVVSAWVLAEESGSAAAGRQSAGNNDWLNVGYTDSGTYGSSDSVWSSPVTAADATASWLKGDGSIPGFGTASSGIQSIMSTAGQQPAAQISAIQSSGWASSGYPDLTGLYAQVTG